MEMICKNENDPGSILTKGRFGADSEEAYMGHFLVHGSNPTWVFLFLKIILICSLLPNK